MLTLTVRLEGDIRPYSYTRSIPLHSSYDKIRMAKACLAVIIKENPSKQGDFKSPWVITCLGVSASKFVDQVGNSSRIDRFFVAKQTTMLDIEKEKCVDVESLHQMDGPYDIHTDEEDQTDEVDVSERTLTEKEGIHIVTPEYNTANVTATCPVISQEMGETNETTVDNHSPCPIQENREEVKRTGFFASRSLKKCAPTQNVSGESATQSTQGNPVNQATFSIEEMFPDLDQVDMETLALLPPHLRRQVLQAIQSKQGNDGSEKFTVCDKCKQQFLKEEIGEHNDFHLASELQKEFSLQPSTSSSVVNNLEGSTAVKKSAKRPLKNHKNTRKDTKRSRTIESFFGNSC